MAYRRPPLAVFIEAVKRYDKRIGLRMLYKEFEVPAESRPVFRKMWDKIAQEIEHASGKGKGPEKPPKKKTKKKKPEQPVSKT